MLKSNTSKRYSDAEKLELIQAYKSSGMLMDQFSRIYGLGHSTLSRWMYNFAHSNEILDDSSMKKSVNSSKSYKEFGKSLVLK